MNESKLRLAIFNKEGMRTWPGVKKAWVKAEAIKLAAAGSSPCIRELGLNYDKQYTK